MSFAGLNYKVFSGKRGQGRGVGKDCLWTGSALTPGKEEREGRKMQ